MDKLVEFLKDNKDFFMNFPRKSSYTANEVAKLREKYPDAPVNEILSQILLQNKMTNRVEHPNKMIFTPKAAEQATVWQIAKYHAEKLRNFTEIADLCCGIGADLIYLAKGKTKIYAVDSDKTTLNYAKVNSQMAENIVFSNGKAEEFNKSVQAIYIDPDRRYKGKRELNPDNYSPSLNQIYSLFKITKNIMIKLSPAMDYRKISLPIECSLEFVSCCGELKEILLCFGKLANKHHKKVIIVDKNVVLYSVADDVDEEGDLSNYIIEPDPAVIKAGMIGTLAHKLGGKILRDVRTLITLNNPIKTGFGKTYKLVWVDKLKNLNSYLKKNNVGNLVLKTRGFPIKVEEYRKKLKLKGKRKAIILIIQQNGKFVFCKLGII